MNSTIPISANGLWEIKEAESTGQAPLQVEQLYSQHYNELNAFLRSRTADRQLVEVVLQEVYLRLMEMPDLSVIRMPSAYLNRLANNLLIDHLRKQHIRQRRTLDEPVEDMQIEENSGAPWEQVHYTQQLERYAEILSELPPPAMEILILNKLEGLTHSEIAKKYGKSKSWVEKSITKALLHCRKALQESDV